jgi:hypothetical protein
MTNTVNYFEIGSPDPAASKAFYGGLFGWDVGEPSMPARYSMIDEDHGGLWDTSQMGGSQLGDLLRPGRRRTGRDRTGAGPRRDRGRTPGRQRSDRVCPPHRSDGEPIRHLAPQGRQLNSHRVEAGPPQIDG